MLSAICFNLDQSKILSSGNGLIQDVKKVEVVHSGYWTGEIEYFYSKNKTHKIKLQNKTH